MDYSCIGIDFEGNMALVSYVNKNDYEPTTVSTVVGGDDYQIPVCVVKKKGIGQWLYGKDAVSYAKANKIKCESNLLERAENQETVIIEGTEYALQDLFFFFLKKLMALPSKMGAVGNFDRIAITIENVTLKNMQLFWICMEKLKFPLNNLSVMDHRESFCHYVMHQEEDLKRHLAAMFEFCGDKLTLRLLTKNIKQKPVTVSVMEESLMYDNMDKDSFLLGIAKENFTGKMISSVYLTGDGFDGDWMKQSLKYLCSGRRVFLGKNLYSKGCCYAADLNNDYVYLGENELKNNVSLKVTEHGLYKFIPLAEAGKNWYDQQFDYDIYVKGEPEIDLWVQETNGNKPKILTFVLKDWPKRKCDITRVRVSSKPLSPKEIKISVKDLGFGEISQSTNAFSEYTLKLE
ncbi:MAG: hypothetical protein K6E13_05325 [Lachnospiraceae bacterium]|nr:hypothetical protein [Lachnospiraceae bacterium]